MAILCAVDFSRASALALVQADRIATTFQQPLTIVTVGDPLLAAAERVQSGGSPVVVLREALAAFVEEALGAGTRSRHELRALVGEPARGVLDMADAIDAQLVVVSTRGASGVSKFMFGSTAERILRSTTRPLLVVPPSVEGGPMRTIGALREVLAPVDFHDHALDDARIADRVARASQARLRLLHVVPAVDAGRWSVLRASVVDQLASQSDGVHATAMDAAREALAALGEALGGTPEPTLELAEGAVADRIAEVAAREDVDLIVMGLRGVTGLIGGTRVGSVAYRVLCESPVPVLALPAEARENFRIA